MVDYNRLYENFLRESEDLLEDAESCILDLEKGVSPQTIDKIFRCIHTIKGNSGLFDLPNVRELAHSMENSLNQYRNHPPDFIPESIIDLYLTTIDRLRNLLGLGDSKKEEPLVIQDLIQSYQSLGSPEALHTPPQTPPKIMDVEQPPIPSFSRTKEETKQSHLKTTTRPSTSYKIPIPKRCVEEAKSSGEYLSLAVMDAIGIKKGKTLLELENWLRLEIPTIVKISTIPDMVPLWEEAGEGGWKFYIVFYSKEHPEELFKKWNYQPIWLKVLHSPESQQVPTQLPKEKTVPSTQNNPAVPHEVTSSPDSYLKVSTKLIDNLINLAGEAVIARNELLQKVDESKDSNLLASAKKMGALFSKLQEGIMKTRLQELDTVFQKVPRIVRDISRTTGKQADLIIVGGEVELDKNLIDAISDPLTHIIRNALDHGIESPQERISAGKPVKGIIQITALLRGGNVIITIEDDGRGLNREKIEKKILEKGIFTPEELSQLKEEDIYNVLFLPGFSTSDKVTTISGRGVGMDVVRTNLKKVGGTAEIAPRKGGGTIVTLTIPQTLSIVNTLLIQTCGSVYAIPEQNVKELILVDETNLQKVESHLIYDLRGELLPVMDLAQFLKLKIEDNYNPKYLAVVISEKHKYGMLIEEIINPEEIVVKSLGSMFSGIGLFSGATIMGNGETILILDIPGIAKVWSSQANLDERELQIHRKQEKELQTKNQTSSGFLLFKVNNQQFASPVESVPRIEKIQNSHIRLLYGMEWILYKEKSIPLVRLEKIFELEKSHEPNEDLENYFVIIYQIQGKNIGILSSSVEEVIMDIPEIIHDTYMGKGIKGYSTINNSHTLFLNIHELIDIVYEQFFHLSQEKTLALPTNDISWVEVGS